MNEPVADFGHPFTTTVLALLAAYVVVAAAALFWLHSATTDTPQAKADAAQVCALSAFECR
jgi:hypothetical protein